MRTIIEGPDKTGKSTLVKAKGELEGRQNFRFPNGWYREKILSGDVSGRAGTHLLFSETASFWQDPQEDFILDRDILSMIVYQGILLNNMDPMVILNLYKLSVYKDYKPDELIYLVNDPFEEYDQSDIFEAFGYTKIRAAYDEAYRLVELNFPEIKCKKLMVEDVR